MKMEKIYSAVLGFSILGLGILIVFNPKLNNRLWGLTLDFTGINLFVGSFFMTVGFLLIWSIFRNKSK